MKNNIKTTWRKVKLGNVLQLLIDHRGKTPKKLGGNWSSSGIPAISAKNIKNGQIVNEKDIRYVSQKLYDKWMPEKLHSGDILLTSEAPLGELLYLKEKTDYCLSQRLFALRTQSEKLSSKFLYYYLLSPIGRHQLLRRISGTAAEGIRQTELVQLDVTFPENIEEQKRTADILSAFDDKIELNNKISRTLEEMAQAIFKEWFVNFRFPGHEKVKMVDSELGKIPEGWEVKSWGDLESVSLAGDWGYDNASEESSQKVYILRGTDIPSLQAGDRGDCPTRYLSIESLERRKLKAGDIVIEISGGSKGQPTGRSLFITQEILNRFELPLVHTSFCRLVRGNNILASVLMYLHIDRLYRTKKIWNYQLQSTGISNFQYGQFREYERLVVPPRDIQDKISDTLYSYIEYGHRNENQKLAALRDLLLPKLMSGEIRV